MSKVIIPISVELGDSLNKIDKVTKKFKETADAAGKPIKTTIDTAISDAPLKSIRTQLREANIELQNAVANFGKISPQAQAAAGRVAELRDVIEDSGKAAQAADFDDRFQLAGRAITGVASAFQTATALQAVFGGESKKTEEALKKVQAVMALTQGISGIIEGKKAFEALGASASAALKGIKTGIAATGIGLLLVALGTIVAYWDDIKEAVSGVSDEQEKLLKKQEASLKVRQSELEDLKNMDETLKRQGKSEEQILLLKAQKVAETIRERAEILKTNTQIRKAQVEAAERNFTFTKGIVMMLTSPLQVILGAIDLITAAANKMGIITDDTFKTIGNLRNRFTEGITSLVFDPKAEKEAAVKAFDEDRKAFVELTNEYNGYLNRIDELRKGEKEKAGKDAEEKAKKRKEAEEAAAKVLIEINRRNASQAEQAILKIQDEYAEKRKTLAKAGIKDFTEINKAEAEEILAVQTASNNAVLLARQNYEKALFNVIVNAVKKRKELDEQADAARLQSRELAQRAELSGIKDESQRRLQELRNAENKEMEDLEKAYEDKKISLEKFLQDQAAIEAFYANQRAATQTDSQKKAEEELKAFQEKYTGLLESGLEDTVAALFTAIGEGEDPFAALAKTIGNSLGDFAINLGKDLVKLGLLFKALKETLDKLGPGGKIAVGLALIAFGSLVKGAISKRGKKAQEGFATGGFVDGPGTDTSDSIPARLSKGEYVIKAKSVRKYGARVMEKINKGQVPVASLARATSQENNEFFENIISRGRSGGSSKALVNRFEAPLLFANGGYVDDFYENIISRGRSGGSSKALVNRFEVPQFFSDGGLVEATRQFTRHGGTSKALVNRFEMPILPNVNMTETFQREVPYIATTKVSGQDLKIILERADRRYSNAT